MKTSILVDDRLMSDALQATGLRTQEEVIELGLQTLIRLSQQAQIRQFKGKLAWEGNLDEMRQDR
jgi:Arc/MetJ family transcription regulator